MRGLLSLIFSTHPELIRLERGLIVLACSDRYAHRIVAAVRKRMPHVVWSILQREETVIEDVKGRVMLSREAEGLGRKWELLQRVRNERYDIVVTSWTNESGFGLLKLLSLLANARYVFAYNENIDAMVLTRDQWRAIRSHLWWRLTHRSGGGFWRPVLVGLSWMFLFPLGVLYLSFRTLIVLLQEKSRP